MNYEGLFVATHRDVYEPSDDTFLLANVVAGEARPGTAFLEVGCGTGLIAMVAARAGARVTATDANPIAVELATRNARENKLTIDVVETDLMAGLQGRFDVIAFNPPYLPTDDDDHVEGALDIAFDGGLDGNVVVLRFAEQLGAMRHRPGVVVVIHSSLSDPAPLDGAMQHLGYHVEIAAREKHAFEELTVRRYVGGP